MHYVTIATVTMKQDHVIFMNTNNVIPSNIMFPIDLTLIVLLLCLIYVIYHNDLRYCRSHDKLISKLIKRNKELSELAFLDYLTKLPNRISLKNHIDSLIENDEKVKKNFYVLFIDIDDFKQINDKFGHDTGDRLLCKISRRILQNVRKNDFASRIGGDEFIVITNVDATCDVYAIVNRLIANLSQPYHIMDNVITTVSVSIGISIFPPDEVDANIIIRNADTAMYKVKRDGKNGVCFYHDDIIT